MQDATMESKRKHGSPLETALSFLRPPCIHIAHYPTPLMKLAVSLLCENPEKRTGLSSFLPAMLKASLGQFPNLSWVVYLGEGQEWTAPDARIELVRTFPANNRPLARLLADHLRVPGDARRRGAQALLTVGFAPLSLALPVVMHAFSVQHRKSSLGLGYPRMAYRNWALSRGLRKARLVVTNSQFAASLLEQIHGPLPAGRLLISPEGVDHGSHNPQKLPGEIERLSSVLGLRPGYIFWASNFYRYKRAELAISAFAKLPAELRVAHPLVLVGGDWKGLASARATAAQAGVAEQTRFLGWVEEGLMPALFRNAACHVLSSAEETFGRSVLDALACACPCVVQDIPALREVAGGAALYCDYAHPEQAAAVLRSCLEDAELSERLRREGLERASQFSWNRVAQERIGAIRALLAGGVGSRNKDGSENPGASR